MYLFPVYMMGLRSFLIFVFIFTFLRIFFHDRGIDFKIVLYSNNQFALLYPSSCLNISGPLFRFPVSSNRSSMKLILLLCQFL